MSYKTILVIPDAHNKPGVSNRRFQWLGNFIIENQPDEIVDIGDFTDLPSLYEYKGTSKPTEEFLESLKEDIKSAKGAQALSFGPIVEYNKRKTKNKKRKYQPEIIRCKGNHEGRWDKLESSLRNQGILDHWLFDFNKVFGYDVYSTQVLEPLYPYVSNSIAFSHYFYNIMQRSSASSASQALNYAGMSCVFGHTHRRDLAEAADVLGNKKIGLNVGCYLDPDDPSSEYTGPQGQTTWWNGLVMLRGIDGTGYFDPEFIGIEQIRREYG